APSCRHHQAVALDLSIGFSPYTSAVIGNLHAVSRSSTGCIGADMGGCLLFYQGASLRSYESVLLVMRPSSFSNVVDGFIENGSSL
ncbi:MAG: hypothetical protein U9R51_08150, partial [Actinomycetota bacterium]|nr:hypothetical protein [Actinomycetota bacterium]